LFSDAAPQICAYQPHTVWLLRFCTVNAITLPDAPVLASHQYWGQGSTPKRPHAKDTGQRSRNQAVELGRKIGKNQGRGILTADYADFRGWGPERQTSNVQRPTSNLELHRKRRTIWTIAVQSSGAATKAEEGQKSEIRNPKFETNSNFVNF
jgi:hypothetical protein